MDSLLLGLGGLPLLIFIVVLLVLTVILPISVYTAQKWAYMCYVELRKINEREDAKQRALAPAQTAKPPGTTRT